MGQALASSSNKGKGPAQKQQKGRRAVAPAPLKPTRRSTRSRVASSRALPDDAFYRAKLTGKGRVLRSSKATGAKQTSTVAAKPSGVTKPAATRASTKTKKLAATKSATAKRSTVAKPAPMKKSAVAKSAAKKKPAVTKSTSRKKSGVTKSAVKKPSGVAKIATKNNSIAARPAVTRSAARNSGRQIDHSGRAAEGRRNAWPAAPAAPVQAVNPRMTVVHQISASLARFLRESSMPQPPPGQIGEELFYQHAVAELIAVADAMAAPSRDGTVDLIPYLPGVMAVVSILSSAPGRGRVSVQFTLQGRSLQRRNVHARVSWNSITQAAFIGYLVHFNAEDIEEMARYEDEDL